MYILIISDYYTYRPIRAQEAPGPRTERPLRATATLCPDQVNHTAYHMYMYMHMSVYAYL